MLSKILSCQRAQENMYIKGSQPIVHFHGALKKGVVGKKKGISSACDRLRPPVQKLRFADLLTRPTVRYEISCLMPLCMRDVSLQININACGQELML